MSDFIVVEILDNASKTNKQQKQKNKNEAGKTARWVKALAVQAQGTDSGFLETHTLTCTHIYTSTHTQTCIYIHTHSRTYICQRKGGG